eukprot:CAMPEP_0170520864 /NCGR_PEP_ID=MMETSP0209-20121228/6197_1 /TAXON_ID=665100 ORGANISM="Litonotus pictus, Strain P1" /NCGR_SAMPLE_ID=MMETSP0209 /ASSEMBLY_ACC=CAM_ASM_000301 /LENGTH=426 /DNA_ID=CAMNT_0010807437 /DNA_START=764 /DNA_END=2044 /DNA_ORIENTATION=-
MRFITPPFGRLQAIQQSLEGEFRANHKKIINHSEEIAFYNGNMWELVKLTENFRTLNRHIKDVQLKKFFMGIFDSILTRFGPTVVGTFCLAMPIFFDSQKRYNLKNKNENAAVITRDYMKNSSLLVSLAKSIGKIIISYKDLQNLAGYLSSVSDLEQVIKEVNKGQYQRVQVDKTLADKYVGGAVNQDDFIEFQDVPIITPNGELLIKDVNFKILPGQHTFISGANGCGKSSLFRILGELWPVKSGSITKPHFAQIFYVPQKPYLPKGNLRDQIIYPLSYEEFKKRGESDEYLERLMESVDVSHVLKREANKFDTVREWKDVLSGGEKQRVSMARLYYHKPTFAILDECTSAVSIDVEDKMYSHAKNYGITLITVSHRKSLWKFHDFLIRFKEDGVDFGKMNQEILSQETKKMVSNVSENALEEEN